MNIGPEPARRDADNAYNADALVARDAPNVPMIDARGWRAGARRAATCTSHAALFARSPAVRAAAASRARRGSDKRSNVLDRGRVSGRRANGPAARFGVRLLRAGQGAPIREVRFRRPRVPLPA